MIKGIKGLFSDETEVIETQELAQFEDNDIDDSFKIVTKGTEKGMSSKAVVKIYQPVTKSVTMSIIESIKRGELCIVNLEKISDEEARIIYATLSGSIFSLDGNIKMIESKILMCAPRNFVIDGDVTEA
jgi:FtsZ-interacting cell division protein YlmF